MGFRKALKHIPGSVVRWQQCKWHILIIRGMYWMQREVHP